VRHDHAELLAFLRAVDANLKSDGVIMMTIIGGAAAALASQTKLATTDIDIITDITGLEEAVQAAQKQTGLKVTISRLASTNRPKTTKAACSR
jgi:hypothetical protein